MERTVLTVWRQPDKPRARCITTEAAEEEVWTHQRDETPLLDGSEEKGQTTVGASFCVCVLSDSRHSLNKIWGQSWAAAAISDSRRRCGSLLLRVLGEGDDHCLHLLGSMHDLPAPNQAQASALVTSGDVWPTGTTTKCLKTRCQLLPLPSWEHMWIMNLHITHQEENGQHTVRKETASIPNSQIKNSPHTQKLLNPHEPHRDTSSKSTVENCFS